MSQPPYGNQPPYGSQPPYGGQPEPGGSQSGWGQPNPAGQPGYGQPPASPAPSYGQPPTGGQPAYGQPQTGAQPDYGPPQSAASPVYGQPTQQFGQTAVGGYGSPPGGQPPYGGGPGAPYGSPTPSNKSPLPFIIIGLVVLLIAGGVGLFFALRGDDPTPIAQTTAQTTAATGDTDTPTEDTDSPTEDTDDTDSPGGDEPNFDDSEAVAVVFIGSMISGDYDVARASLCEAGQDMFVDGQALADDFLSTLGPGVEQVTDGRPTDVYADLEDPERDIVEFDLTTDTEEVALAVSIYEEDGNLTVCGYNLP